MTKPETAKSDPYAGMPDYLRPPCKGCPLYQRIYDAHGVTRLIAAVAVNSCSADDDGYRFIEAAANVLTRHLWAMLEDGDNCPMPVKENTGGSHE